MKTTKRGAMTDLTREGLRQRARQTIEEWERRAWERRSQEEADDALVDALAVAFTALVAEARREQRKVDARIAWPWADTYRPKPVDRRTVIADAERREIAAEILAEDRVGDAPRVQ